VLGRQNVESTRISEPDLFSDCVRLFPIRRCQLTISKRSLIARCPGRFKPPVRCLVWQTTEFGCGIISTTLQFAGQNCYPKTLSWRSGCDIV
jgi:hypothetical protein